MDDLVPARSPSQTVLCNRWLRSTAHTDPRRVPCNPTSTGARMRTCLDQTAPGSVAEGNRRGSRHDGARGRPSGSVGQDPLTDELRQPAGVYRPADAEHTRVDHVHAVRVPHPFLEPGERGHPKVVWHETEGTVPLALLGGGPQLLDDSQRTARRST